MHIRKIYLSWRPGSGDRRFIVGLFQRNMVEGITFRYLEPERSLANKMGFCNFPGLSDLNKTYTEQDGIDSIVKNRIINLNRPDSKKLLSFWEAINPKYDSFDILGLTQGWTPTDNFEFLGVFFPEKGFSFVTDLASVKKRNLDATDVEDSKYFRYEREPDNPYDSDAVKIYNSSGVLLGYIKKIHNKFFYQLRDLRPDITLKVIENNNIVKKIFLKISV